MTTLSQQSDEQKELQELTIELLDTLLIIGKRFLDYKTKYQMEIEGMDSLTRLFEKAKSLTEEIGWPYSGSMPIKSRPVTGKDESPEGNSTKEEILYTPIFTYGNKTVIRNVHSNCTYRDTEGRNPANPR